MTNYRKHTLSTAILIMSALLLSACYKFVKTTKPIEPEPPEIQHKIREGSRVYIQTKDGRELTLKVSQVTAEAIIGIEISLTEVEAIPFDQIETLGKKGFGTIKPIELEPPEIQHKIRRGNKVYIQTKDGRELVLKVSHVTAEAIIGIEIGVTEVEAVPFDQIETLDKEVGGFRRMSKDEIEESAKELAEEFVEALAVLGLTILALILLYQ